MYKLNIIMSIDWKAGKFSQITWFRSTETTMCQVCYIQVSAESLLFAHWHSSGRCIDCIFNGQVISIYRIHKFGDLSIQEQHEIDRRIHMQQDKLNSLEIMRQRTDVISQQYASNLTDEVYSSLLVLAIPSVLIPIVVDFVFNDQMIVSVNKMFHCLDTRRRWEHAFILQIENESVALVKYCGWDEKWNEWIEFAPDNKRFNVCSCSKNESDEQIHQLTNRTTRPN